MRDSKRAERARRYRERHQRAAAANAAATAAAAAAAANRAMPKTGGAIIESMHHHGKGVYSGTFSGILLGKI